MANSIPTNVVWPNYDKVNVQAAAKRQPSDTLGKDQFLSILVAQLRNQDPMQPMQDRDFIAQMAQFTSVEQLMNMSGELALMRQSIGSASSLIGKWVQWYEYDEAGQVTTSTGQVDSILSKDGILYSKIGNKEVALDYLVSISEKQPQENGNEEGSDEVETP
ncbi:flagellar hook capping FlgD N-terminal domain-containing protein [Paenibacillus sp. NPDC057967]|uniref:flagellar hook capping FlgD N-terminal domain-containing protein n=1 Tax=Paenibacillus sp. NPDC057967 TaxID=3346293 RepID=UPI0036DB8085